MADIIIVEDNVEIGNLLCDFLRKEKYSVCLATTGEKALELFEKYGAKVFVLDIMLPGFDGLAVCSKIRETSNAYIIIASAKSEKEDKLTGLNLGADDYVEKPYDIDILLAKIKGVFKRKYAIAEIHEGNLVLNTVNNILTVKGKMNKSPPVILFIAEWTVTSFFSTTYPDMILIILIITMIPIEINMLCFDLSNIQ